jgi:Phage capsid family
MQPIPLRADPGALTRRNVNALTRACIAKATAKLDSRRDERAILKERWPDDPIALLVLRAASAPASLAGTPALAATLVSDIVSTLGPTSAGAKLLQAGLQVTFGPYATIYVPALQAISTQASFVTEGVPIPVHDLVTKATPLVPHKLATIVTLSREMIEASNAEALVTDALGRSIGLALDAALFDSAAADAVRPAGLRHGIAALLAAAATNPDDAMLADLTATGGAVAAIGSPIIFIASPARAVTIALRARRSPFPFTVLGSPALAPNDVIAVTGVGLASAVADVPDIDASKVATLHEEDTTAADIVSGAGVVAFPVRSLMQTDAVGIRLRFDVDWCLRDPRAVAWTTATAW